MFWITIAVFKTISICFAVTSMAANFDPDVDICTKPVVEAAVYTDNGISYIFKGNYFWKTKQLNVEKGIVGYGNLITDKWPELKSKIKTVFVIPKPGAADNSTLVTVFVVNNKWYGYQNDVKTMDGTTDGWPSFNDFKITATVASKRGSPLVVVLHSDNKKAATYEFSNLKSPKLLVNKATNVRKKLMTFWDDLTSAQQYAVENNFDEILTNTSAAIGYDTTVMFFGSDQYCIMDLTLGIYEKACNSIPNINQLFKCPIDTSQRPTIEQPEPVTKPDSKLNSTESDTDVETDLARNSPNPANTTVGYDEQKVNIYIISYIIVHVFVTALVLVIITIVYCMERRPKGTIVFIDDKNSGHF